MSHKTKVMQVYIGNRDRGETMTHATEKRSIVKSFADLDKASIKTTQPPFAAWSAESRALECVGRATETLMTWLTARFQDLVRERVPLESIQVTQAGGRCVVKVDNKVRFEFKVKCTMEGK